jgi:hypothetical protein
MNGFNNLPNKSDQNTYIFYANASSSISGSFQAWNVPEYAAFLHFTVIGGGAGGGSGFFSSGSAQTQTGGGGGASGGIVTVSIPTILLPKTLYLQVGYGGKGGAAQTISGSGLDGQSGSLSYICLCPEINAGSVLIQSSNTAPGGGLGNSTVGSAITIADTTNLKWLGIVGNTVAQTAGTAGGNSSNTVTPITYAGLLTGGGGGGGIRNTGIAGTGGSIAMTSIGDFITTTIAGGTGNNPASGDSTAGSVGYFSWKPFIATGGAGGGGQGGTTITFAGKSGGKGAYGCGGGGGGAGRYISSGAGGDGGDGLIIITVA